MTSRARVRTVQPMGVQPGDLAEHVNGQLDGRIVTRVDVEAGVVWIDVLGGEVGPLPIENYTYTRWVTT